MNIRGLDLPTADLAAAFVLLFGVGVFFLRHKLARGVGASSLAVCTLAAATIYSWWHGEPSGKLAACILHVSALTCPLWAILARLTGKSEHGRNIQTTKPGHSSDAPVPTDANKALATSAVFQTWAFITGTIASALLLYLVLIEMASRVLTTDRISGHLSLVGAGYIAALLLAVLVGTPGTRHPRQPAAMLFLSALLLAWISLTIPSAGGSYADHPEARWPGQSTWWTWTFLLQLAWAILLASASVVQEIRYRSSRDRAWPDQLDNLLVPYSIWPGFIQLEAIIAALVLLLGVYHIVREGPLSWPLAVGNMAASLLAGLTCLFMTYRRWSANTTGLGIALLTLAAVAMSCALIPLFASNKSSVEYAVRLPTIYNAILFALALTIAWWRWLANVWHQQLHEGRAWTTTGRMIPYIQRAVFLLTALAVLVAYQMALWPGRGLTGVEDNSLGRMVAGLTALVLLMLISMRHALRIDWPVLANSTAGLSIAFLGAALLFAFLRVPAPMLRGWLRQYDAVVYSASALPLFAMAYTLPKTKWRPFVGACWWLGLLILPAGALMEVLKDKQPASEWIRPVTFTLLGGLYLLAGSQRQRRALWVLGGVLILAAVRTGLKAYGIHAGQ